MKFEKMTRQEAIDKKINQFFNGEPCLRGHIDYRWTLNGRCKACSREDGRARYQRIKEQLSDKNQ